MKFVGAALLIVAGLLAAVSIYAYLDPTRTNSMMMDGLAVVICLALVAGGIAALRHDSDPMQERIREKYRRKRAYKSPE